MKHEKSGDQAENGGNGYYPFPFSGRDRAGRYCDRRGFFRPDPGADLVAVAQRRGLKVVPLVGPSSILLALMGSGFNGQSFAFNGYLPIHQPQRGAKLKEMERRIIKERQTQIFIETPYRNNRLIAELASSLPGDRLLCVASDLTGDKERIVTRPLSRWARETLDFDKIPAIFLLF